MAYCKNVASVVILLLEIFHLSLPTLSTLIQFFTFDLHCCPSSQMWILLLLIRQQRTILPVFFLCVWWIFLICPWGQIFGTLWLERSLNLGHKKTKAKISQQTLPPQIRIKDNEPFLSITLLSAGGVLLELFSMCTDFLLSVSAHLVKATG